MVKKQQQVTVAGKERDVAIFVFNMVVLFLFVLRCAYGGIMFLFQPIKWIRHKVTSNDPGVLCKSYVQQENTMACWGIRLVFFFLITNLHYASISAKLEKNIQMWELKD